MELDADNPEGTSIEETTAAFERLLGGGEPNPDTDDEDEVDPSEAEADEEASDEDETTDDAEGEDGAEDDAEADVEDDEGDDEDLDRLVTVKVDGKTQQVPLREALNGYQRQADYQRKTAQLAEERRSFTAQVQEVQAERQQYAELLGEMEARLRADLPEPNWAELERTDPVAWAIARQKHAERLQQVQQVQAERQRVAAQMQEANRRAYAEHLQSERERLLEARPEWKDEKVWTRVRAEIRDYGKSLGFTEEELSATADHRAVLALHKAMQFDRLANRKERPVARKQASPKVAPSRSTVEPPARVDRKAKELTRAKQRLAKTGRVQDAAKAFELLL